MNSKEEAIVALLKEKFPFECGFCGISNKYSDEEFNLISNFTNVTPENCMKPINLQPKEGEFTFKDADNFILFAQTNNLKVNAHTLVWHNQSPDWFFKDAEKLASKELVLSRLIDHITIVCKRYRGKVASWDVVNEAIDANELKQFRESNWFKILGKEFILESFKAARAADPLALLYYNDYGIEKPNKRAKTLDLLKYLIENKAPIDGVGIQGHYSLFDMNLKDIEDSIIAYSSLGLKISFTEVDIDCVAKDKGTSNNPYKDGLPEEVQIKLANNYSNLIKLFLKHKDKINRVTFWGLHDGRSWLNHWPYERTNYPLLFDRKCEGKGCYYEIMKL